MEGSLRDRSVFLGGLCVYIIFNAELRGDDAEIAEGRFGDGMTSSIH